MLKAGDKAPDFSLENEEGKMVSLNDFKGKRIVFYFYPKDNTPGCTTEGMEFSLLTDKISKMNVQVLGVSPDTPESHKQFRDKHKLKIILLSDPGHEAASAYFAYGEKNNYGKKYMGIIRSTFIIDDGIIKEALYNVKAAGHAERVFKILENLN